MSEEYYVLTDEQATKLWSSLIGNFVGPEHWRGSNTLRTFILASIKRRSQTVTTGDTSGHLQQFLESLDIAFRRGPDLLKRHEYSEIIESWSPIVANPLFDPNHPEWVDKPYFRCQIGSGICQLFVAHANSSNVKDVGGWYERVLGYVSQMIELESIDPQRQGYFYDKTEAASAQNYNLAMTLNLALDWMKDRSPKIIATMSNISESRAYDIETALRRRVNDTAIYLDN